MITTQDKWHHNEYQFSAIVKMDSGYLNININVCLVSKPFLLYIMFLFVYFFYQLSVKLGIKSLFFFMCSVSKCS